MSAFLCDGIVRRETRKVQGYNAAEWELTDPGRRSVLIGSMR